MRKHAPISRAVLAVGLLLGVASAAHAGTRVTEEVEIDMAARTASGAMGSARTGSGEQMIGCTAVVTDTGQFAGCIAIDADGNSASCLTGSVELLEVFHNLGNDSFISFSWDTSGFCSSLEVRNYSYYAPKQ